MFRQIVRFFRRIFQSKGLRTAARIIFWMLAGYFLFSYIYAVTFFMRHEGMTFHEAASLTFEAVFYPLSRTFLSIAAGIIIGLVGFYRGRKKKEAAEEEKPAETPEPEPAREEEFTETNQYMSR